MVSQLSQLFSAGGPSHNGNGSNSKKVRDQQQRQHPSPAAVVRSSSGGSLGGTKRSCDGQVRSSKSSTTPFQTRQERKGSDASNSTITTSPARSNSTRSYDKRQSSSPDSGNDSPQTPIAPLPNPMNGVSRPVSILVNGKQKSNGVHQDQSTGTSVGSMPSSFPHKKGKSAWLGGALKKEQSSSPLPLAQDTEDQPQQVSKPTEERLSAMMKLKQSMNSAFVRVALDPNEPVSNCAQVSGHATIESN